MKNGRNGVNMEDLVLMEDFDFGSYTSGRFSSGEGIMTLEATDTGYVLKASETSGERDIIVDVPTSELNPDSFGFFSDHYEHDCDQIGYFYIDNIRITAVRRK